jgi:hypothetical protein
MTCRVVYEDANTRCGVVDDRVLVQVRFGELTIEAVEAIGREAQVLARGAGFAALLIQEATASVPSGPVRDVQQRVVKSVTGADDAMIAAVSLGDDVKSRMRTVLGKFLTMGDKRFGMFDDVDKAIAWLVTGLAQRGRAANAASLRAAVTELRGR